MIGKMNGLTVPTVRGHIEIAKLALLGKAAMAATKTATVEKALAVLAKAPPGKEPRGDQLLCPNCGEVATGYRTTCKHCGADLPSQKSNAAPAADESADDDSDRGAAAAKSCASCQGNNPALALFCAWCGSPYDTDTPEPESKPAPKAGALLSARDVRRIRAAGLDPDEVAAVARQQMRGVVLTTNRNPSKLSIATQLRARNAGIDPELLEAQLRQQGVLR